MSRTQAPEDVRVPDRMKRGNDPKIAGPLVQDSEEQPDGEDGSEHRYGERGSRSKIIPVQRTERVEQVGEDDSERRAPSARGLRLHHAAVHELLVEAEQKVRGEHGPEAPSQTELRDPARERRCEHEGKDDIRGGNHLKKIRLLRHRPVAPRSKAKL